MYVNKHVDSRYISYHNTEASHVHRGLAGWLACQRVGAYRLAGLQTPTTQTAASLGNGGSTPSVRAVPPGEQDEALTLRRELHFLSASFLRGAIAAALSDHGAAPAWGSSGSRARRSSGAGSSSGSER